MAYTYPDSVDNIYLLDNRFFGFPRYGSAFVVKGENKTVLVDTGDCNQPEAIRSEMARVGVTIKDIDYIFITHCEHNDHAGNAGFLAMENPDVKICINPAGEEYLTHPELEAAERKRILPPGMAERFGMMHPVDPKQLYYLTDGEEFDIGGDTLKVIFAPGHQPSGIVIEESRNKVLFINDLCGMYLAEFDFAIHLTPDKSSPVQALEALRKLSNNTYDWLALGHYGFCDDPDKVINGSIGRIEQLMAIAEKCEAEGTLDQLRQRIKEQVTGPKIEKLGEVCEEYLYVYLRDELGPNLCNGFARFYDRYRASR